MKRLFQERVSAELSCNSAALCVRTVQILIFALADGMPLPAFPAMARPSLS